MGQNRTAGFTLTEVLVVLGIVFVLAALLFPVFASARRRAWDAACVSNLQQIGHALAMYTADYDGVFPATTTAPIINGVGKGGKNWRETLLPYLHTKQFPSCEATESPGFILSHLIDAQLLCGYALNDNLNANQGTRERYHTIGRMEAHLNNSSSTITVADARAGICSLTAPDMGRTGAGVTAYASVPPGKEAIEFIAAQQPGAVRHHSGANYVFADGHVEWLLPAQISSSRQNNGQNPGFGL